MNLRLPVYDVGKGNILFALAFIDAENRMRRLGQTFPWEKSEIFSLPSKSAAEFHKRISVDPAAARVYSNGVAYNLLRTVGRRLITDENTKRFCEEAAETGDGVFAFQNMVLEYMMKVRKGNKVGVYSPDSIHKPGIPQDIDFAVLRDERYVDDFSKDFPDLSRNHILASPLIPELIARGREEHYARRKESRRRGDKLHIVLNPSRSGVPYYGHPLMLSLTTLLGEGHSLTVIGSEPKSDETMILCAEAYCEKHGLRDDIVDGVYTRPEEGRVRYVKNYDVMKLIHEATKAICDADLVVCPSNEAAVILKMGFCPGVIYRSDRGIHEIRNREEAEGDGTVYVLKGDNERQYLTCADQIRGVERQLDAMMERCHTYAGPYEGNEKVVQFVARMILLYDRNL